MLAREASDSSRAVAQAVTAPLTRAAIFLIVSLKPGLDSRATLRSLCTDLAALVRAVEFRDIEAALSCVMGFGSDAWDQLFGQPRPAQLHVFPEIRAGARHAVSTPWFACICRRRSLSASSRPKRLSRWCLPQNRSRIDDKSCDVLGGRELRVAPEYRQRGAGRLKPADARPLVSMVPKVE
jgi:hypothetical protein